MPAQGSYNIAKNWWGTHLVKYQCPTCGEQLRSVLSDAGKIDHCPSCRHGFVVPGEEALQRITAASQAAEREVAQRNAQRREAELLRSQQQAAARAQALADAAEARRQRELHAQEVRQEAERRIEIEQNAEAMTREQELSEAHVAAENPVDSRKKYLKWIAVAAFSIVAFIAYYAIRNAGLRSKLQECESFEIVKVRVAYSGFLSTDTVVFDVRDGGSVSARRIDPVHLLMQFADKLDLHSVDRVVLAKNGQHRFYIEGSDLRRLSDSYAGGGRVWAFNNLPANVRRMNGEREFEEWSGGWLGVIGQQAVDVNLFITEWTDF